jgi:FKBP-type peptidyl-prolyl cis-trans isomerase
MRRGLTILLIFTIQWCYSQKKDTIFLENGLKYIRVHKGKGKTLENGQKIKVLYSGYIAATQKKFDSNIGQKPFQFTLGADEVIKGWDIALIHCKVKEKIKLFIPSDLGYGSEGIPNVNKKGRYIIPPNSDLYFEIEVIEAK